MLITIHFHSVTDIPITTNTNQRCSRVRIRITYWVGSTNTNRYVQWFIGFKASLFLYTLRLRIRSMKIISFFLFFRQTYVSCFIKIASSKHTFRVSLKSSRRGAYPQYIFGGWVKNRTIIFFFLKKKKQQNKTKQKQKKKKKKTTKKKNKKKKKNQWLLYGSLLI